MSWRASNTHLVAPGATIRIYFSWPAPGDRGPQWVLAHTPGGEPPVWLVTERVAKRLNCSGLMSRVAGTHLRWCLTGLYWEYFVDFSNAGGQACRFQLEGGQA